MYEHIYKYTHETEVADTEFKCHLHTRLAHYEHQTFLSDFKPNSPPLINYTFDPLKRKHLSNKDTFLGLSGGGYL